MENDGVSQDWVQIGRVTDLPRGGGRLVRSNRGNVAVFRTSDDRIYALGDRCPHKGGPLSQGMVCGHSVCCPLHGMMIDLESGQAVAPDEGRTPRYSVRIEAGVIYLDAQELAGGGRPG